MFANISSYPVRFWIPEQLEAAKELADDGPVVDVHFPYVSPDDTVADIQEKARTVVGALSSNVKAAMVQGEFILALEICKGLIARGIPCFNAALDRTYDESGNQVRKFVAFREIIL